MVSKSLIKKIPAKLWKVIATLGAIAGTILSMWQLSDYYWKKVDTLVKGSVTQSTINLTAELRKTERAFGSFLIDDIRFRIIGIEDEIDVYIRTDSQPPMYLKRQLMLLKDQLNEAKDRWGN